MKGMRRSALLLTTALVGFACFGAVSGAFAADSTYQFDIPAESLGKALNDFSQASAQQIIFSNEAVAGRKSAGLHGSYTIAQALSALLAGTDLVVETNASGVLMVHPKKEQAASNEGAAAPSSNEVETVTVTGSHIPGATTSSPLLTVGQKDFRLSGAAQLQDIFASLPQNSGSGLTAATALISPNSDAYSNTGEVSSVDLRGLGSGATLVLLDGQRLAPNGSSNVVDISTIPLSAVDHVDILTDGASAIYGSDAVAGVVNIVLKKDFDGAESSAEYGAATRGGTHEDQVSQLGGFTWDGGNVVADYEYDDSTPLLAGSRSFANGVPPTWTLTPDQLRNSGTLIANQEISSAVEIWGRVFYTAQDKVSDNALYGLTVRDRMQSFAGSGGLSWSLDDDWHLDWTENYSSQRDRDAAFVAGVPAAILVGIFDNISSFSELKLDGSLLELPAGDVKSAFGVGYNDQTYTLRGYDQTSGKRDVFDAYAEFEIPILKNVGPLLQSWTADAAVRSEHYSDFGWTTNPKIGTTWEINDDVRFRGTWGTSFQAPTLDQLDGPSVGILEPVADPTVPSGSTLTLIQAGGNPSLTPEKSSTFTIGTDVTPRALPGLKVSLSYFNTDFTNRIQFVNQNQATWFADEAQYPQAVIRNPSAATVSNLISSFSQFYNYSGGPVVPGSVGAIFRNQDLNIASSTTNGIDFTSAYNFDTGVGSFDWTFNGAFLLENSFKDSALSPSSNLLNKIFYTPAVRIRTGLAWSEGPWEAAGYLNFTNSYVNNSVVPDQSVGAYTTFDAHLSYAPEYVPGLRVSLDVKNLFDASPPYVAAATYYYSGLQFGYDPANADPIGRFVSVRVTERW